MANGLVIYAKDKAFKIPARHRKAIILRCIPNSVPNPNPIPWQAFKDKAKAKKFGLKAKADAKD